MQSVLPPDPTYRQLYAHLRAKKQQVEAELMREKRQDANRSWVVNELGKMMAQVESAFFYNLTHWERIDLQIELASKGVTNPRLDRLIADFTAYPDKETFYSNKPAG